MGIAGGPKIVSDDLVLSLDSCLAASYPGDPVTNIYGDISSSSSLRPSRTEYNTDASWRSVAGVPMCPDPTIGRIYKHTSGSLTSSWSGNSYGYTLKDLTTDSSSTYILTCWVYVSEDSNLTALPCSIEQASSTANVTNYPQYYEMDRKGTWQLLAKKCVADAQVRFIPIYPQRNGVTDGSFSGFYLWGGASVVKADYVTPYVSSSRSTTDAFKDLSKNANDADFVNDTSTGTSSYRDGSIIYIGNMFAGDNATLFKSNNYIDFDGTDDYAVVTNGMNSLVGTNATTFGAWIYIDTVTSSWDGVIANKVNVAEGIALLVSNTQKIFFQYDSTSGNYAIDGGSNIPTAKWTYIVGTYDTVAGYKTYMNGELNDSEADAGKSIASSGDMSINIGAQRNSSGNPGAYFPGRIAKAEIYNKALSAAEIKSNYNQFKGRFGL